MLYTVVSIRFTLKSGYGTYVVSEPAVTRLNASSLSLAGFSSSAGSLLSSSS